jgi:DNA-binding NarL/FixJ family response regulator
MIRVLIKASSSVVEEQLEDLLSAYPQFQITHQASDDRDSFKELLRDFEPDVILAEAEAREIGAEALDHTASQVASILLVRDPSVVARTALGHGARGVLPSNASGSQIAAAIEAVAAGLFVIGGDEIGQIVSPRTLNDASKGLLEPLTPRELEVLRAMADGLANKEIAGRLGISENTIKFHVASVMGKLGAASRTEAVMLGIRHGIVLI